MTRIRDLLIAWRIRRARQLNNSDSVSFEAFCNEAPITQHPTTKESSLTNNCYKTSPKNTKTEEYVRFQSETNNSSSKCTRPSLATILLLILLLAVFLILPIIYLLHCFGVVNVDYSLTQHAHNHHNLKDKEHYAPSSKIHQELDDYSQHDHYIFQEKHPGDNLLPPPKPDYKQCKLLKDDEKLDCYPEDGANESACEDRGCCWIQRKTKNLKNKRLNVPLDVPYCFYPPNYQTYRYFNITETAYGLTAFLKRKYKSAYPADVDIIKMTVKYESENRVHVKVTDPSHSRFEPPYPEVPIVDRAALNLTYKLELNQDNTGFRVIRKVDNTIIFDSYNLGNFIFSDQFLQMSAKLPSHKIYGLGEHRSHLLLSTDWQRFTMFNHDGIPKENANLYGSHPFYLSIEPSGNSHGVFLLNSNAMGLYIMLDITLDFEQ